MRAVRFHEHGGPDVLTVDDVDDPAPAAGQVVVDVRSVGVNPVDTYFREGAYPVPELPFVPGSDLAGVVEAVGDGVERFAEGDRVFGTGLGNGMSGTYAERVAAPAEFLAHLPDDVSFDRGAALALVGTTAWQALVHHAALEPAEIALIHGGNGGVGHVAVQLARTVGATVYTTARGEYRERLESLGADEVFEYDAGDLREALLQREPPSVILDTRMDEYLSLDAEVAAKGARIVGVGNAANEGGFDSFGTLKGKELRYQFMSMYNTADKASVLSRLAALCDRGDVVPHVARRYDLDDAAEAQRAVLEDSFLGKIVLSA
jgi:NADPH:quinone reductase-like Zn-dependent oxidoreductase